MFSFTYIFQDTMTDIDNITFSVRIVILVN